MPFGDIVELFEYWADYPPLHLMVRSYLGYESQPKFNAIDAARDMRVISGGRRAQKLSQASDIDRQRFEALKQQVKEKKRG
jgi:hypothetical protein